MIWTPRANGFTSWSMEFLGQDRREGLGRKAHSRFNLVLLMLVSVLLLLSSLYSAQASVFKKAREGVMDAASPVLTLFAGPINAFNNMAGSVTDYFNVMEQNKALREENAELRQWMVEALQLREVVASYEALEGYQAPPNAQPINAFVIGEANDAFARSMIVNAGRTNNVEVGHAVVDNNGLIGRIVEAGNGASRVLLLTDIQSRIPVYVEGADVEGILVGNTRARPAISFTESADEAETAMGQRVLTSGAGGVLPRGLPVGVVSGEARGEIIVDLYANYARTRMVRVINYAFPEVDPVTDEAAEEALDGDAPAPAEG
ncbi:rod shape-determining protein MreC [Hyphococcus flavus]|uniref:Cell shape-determining protein MreC n=1 Tax=Hyphococcus flavus TaxID=1866326 RepID=A0AAF0CG79_9PROT|nr:rod shape-determining protein MreC [Hyphococcus flavus]WDI32054.1 rod shape-determining protein MreC [Hyphococcus flavus]